MEDIIQELKTPAVCLQLAKNVRDNNPDLAQKARRRAVELRAISHGSNSGVELELFKSVYAYEEFLYEKHKKHLRAAYTWRMIKNDGIIRAAEKAVNRKIDPAGYKALVKMGMHDLTFEAVIIRHPDAFNEEVVSRAKARLEELSGMHTTSPMNVSLSGFDRHLQRLSKSGSVHKNTAGRKDKYEDKVREILANAENYHDTYYKAEIFSGPSLYFHQRALATRNPPVSSTHLEYVYATLASWGMHRMGSSGPKMQSFHTFFQSVEPLNNGIAQAQGFDFHEMTDMKWAVLKEIFLGIKVMASGTSIVGHSKVMHHMLPNVIPPIDREYTLWFLHGSTNIKNDLESEWLLMKEIISQFFIPVASDTTFSSKAEQWMKRNEDYPWDTSVLKVVDNLVIGSKK
ncbi:MAG: hypothetical protein NT140_08315 [Deltaproteobacteria bacterium]|nr:hypothetical protein [Deltaproteobacteria bacterium]